MQNDTNHNTDRSRSTAWADALRRLGFGLGPRGDSGFQTIELLDLSGGPLRNATVGVAVAARLLGDGMELAVLERCGDEWQVHARRAVADLRHLRDAILEATRTYFGRIESDCAAKAKRAAAAA